MFGSLKRFAEQFCKVRKNVFKFSHEAKTFADLKRSTTTRLCEIRGCGFCDQVVEDTNSERGKSKFSWIRTPNVEAN